jgi:hypothetical protein
MAFIKMTRDLAYAASLDAGNRAMHRGGRKTWIESDYEEVNREFTRLWPDCPHGCEPQNCIYCCKFE